jgi:hypothetical protein
MHVRGIAAVQLLHGCVVSRARPPVENVRGRARWIVVHRTARHRRDIYILVLHRRARTAACAAAVGVRGPRLRFRGSGRPGAASWAGRTGSSGWKEVGEKDRALSAGPRRRAEGTRLTAGSPCGQPETTAGALRRVRQRAGDG